MRSFPQNMSFGFHAPRKAAHLLSLSLVAALFFAAFPARARAQNLDRVTTQLTSLTHLPAEEWRFHAGDIAHGESVSLDDSSWQVVKGNSEAPTDAVWYRRWIEIPKNLNGYDLTGTK